MLVYDLADPQEMLGFVRNLPFSQFTLDTILPNDMIDDIEYRFTRSDLVDQDVAPYRAWDAESAIGSRQGLARVLGEIPPVSKKIRLGEEARLRLRSLQVGGDTGALVNAIFDDAANMARSVTARIEQARGRAIYDGKFVVDENGFKQTIDFGIPGTHRVSAATAWSDIAAPAIENMVSWVQTYVDSNGFPPGFALTSTAVMNNLVKNTQVRTFAGLGSIAGLPPLVSQEVLASVLVAHGLPPIVVNDEVVRVGGVSTRVIPADRFVYLPPSDEPLGTTAFGITAESLELAEAGQITTEQAPGLVAVVDKTFDPVSLWTKAAAVAMPVIANARMILTADVQ